jgi:hypothetical protein
MKKIERGTTKYLILLILMVALFGIILYPLFDLILCKFITNTEFTYSIHSHIIQPIIFACVYGTTFWLLDKKNNR